MKNTPQPKNRTEQVLNFSTSLMMIFPSLIVISFSALKSLSVRIK